MKSKENFINEEIDSIAAEAGMAYQLLEGLYADFFTPTEEALDTKSFLLNYTAIQNRLWGISYVYHMIQLKLDYIIGIHTNATTAFEREFSGLIALNKDKEG